jgi:hypothetical protein
MPLLVVDGTIVWLSAKRLTVSQEIWLRVQSIIIKGRRGNKNKNTSSSPATTPSSSAS